MAKFACQPRLWNWTRQCMCVLQLLIGPHTSNLFRNVMVVRAVENSHNSVPHTSSPSYHPMACAFGGSRESISPRMFPFSHEPICPMPLGTMLWARKRAAVGSPSPFPSFPHTWNPKDPFTHPQNPFPMHASTVDPFTRPLSLSDITRSTKSKAKQSKVK